MNSNNIQGFVITIESLFESVNASKRCIASGAVYGFTKIDEWIATTPKTTDIKEFFEHYKIPIKKFLEFDLGEKPDNVMACFASHFRLWHYCTMIERPIGIFEHDAVFCGGFDNDVIPEFDGLLTIGTPSYGGFHTPKNGVHILASKQYLPGAHAYLLKPDAAQKLLDQARIHPKPTDVFLHLREFPWIQEYYPWIVRVQDDFSTIQTPKKGCKSKHAYRKNPEDYQILEV